MANDWDAEIASGEVGANLPNQIVVQVGFKPNPYFENPKIKEIRIKAKAAWARAFPLPNLNPDKPIKFREGLGPSNNFLEYKPKN